MKDRKNRKGSQRVLLIVLCVVLAVILSTLLVGTIYVQSMMNKINRVDNTSAPTLSSEDIFDIENPNGDKEHNPAPTIDSEDITWGADPDVNIGGNGIVNILLIGQDRREGEGRARSDAMILCTFNKNKGSIIMTSFMRDLYVQIPGYLDNRINAAYALGGMQLLDETIYQNFGVKIDGNIEVDFSQFASIIDLLGGVDIELTQSEADFLYVNGNWDVSDTAYTWDLSAGMNHLTGEQATAYSRIRYIGNGDFGRTNRQRTVLKALISAYQNVSLPKMLSLLDDILPMITTDLSDSQIIGYATKLFPMLLNSSINTQCIPGDDAYYGANIRGMSVLVPDQEKCRQMLIDTLS